MTNLKTIKEYYEKIISQHFQEIFGEFYNVETNFGIPTTVVHVKLIEETKSSEWKFTFDTFEKTFNIDSFATKKEGENIVPDWSGISSEIINFVIDRTILILENILSGTVPPEQPADVDIDANETQDLGEVFEEEEVDETSEEAILANAMTE